jgi:hypothetical protein
MCKNLMPFMEGKELGGFEMKMLKSFNKYEHEICKGLRVPLGLLASESERKVRSLGRVLGKLGLKLESKGGKGSEVKFS